MLVETTAAALYGGSDPVFAQLRDQAADAITWGFFDSFKDKLVDIGKGVANNARQNVLGFSEVSSTKLDGQVAQYILTELANGNADFLKALSQIAHSTVRPAGRVAAQVDSEVNAQIQYTMWEKVKNFFSRKKDAQTASESAAIDKLLNAEVSSYLTSQSEGVFDDLKAKIVRAQADDDNVNYEDLDHDGIPDYLQHLRAEITVKDINDAVAGYVLSQGQWGFDFGGLFNSIKNKVSEVKDSVENNVNNLKDGVMGNINGLKDAAIGQAMNAIA